MLSILVGYQKYELTLNNNTQYVGDQVYNRIITMNRPLWLHMDGSHFKLTTDCQIRLACELVATYHNEVFYNRSRDDGWMQETLRMEESAVDNMIPSNSDEDQDEYAYAEIVE